MKIKNTSLESIEGPIQDSPPRLKITKSQSMGAGLWSIVLLLFGLFCIPNAEAQTCATPGRDGAGGTLTGIVNTYYPGTANRAAGSTNIAVGAATGASVPIASGDLLLVIQMQDASISSSNNTSYGDGIGGDPASGYTNANNVGRYEFVRATSALALAGGTVNIQGTGSGNGLINSYTNAAASGSQGQRRFQVIRVPQYTTAKLSSGLTALAWNGTTGGVLSIDVNLVLVLDGTVSVDGLGFRPGAGRQLTGDSGGNDHRSQSTLDTHGSKGEGIAGTPRYMYIAASNSVLDNSVEGYPNGSYAKGAPGNAGGGGTDGNPSVNDENSGGGGGGNRGAGGRGGNTWASDLARGGWGGAVFAQSAVARLVMGGGGGAGTRNNNDGNVPASSGGAGGGIVIIRAGSISGTGTISANGADAYNDSLNDGAGGGGAGGTVLVWVEGGVLTGLTVTVTGGRGGDAWRTEPPNGTPGERHGPGGGGGGGAVFLSTAAASVTVSGGANGITTTANDAFSATPGGAGASTTGITDAQIPGVASGATCTLAPSAIELERFEAKSYNGRVFLEWETGREAQNLGFRVHREENGELRELTKSLIAGSALLTGADTLLTTARSYGWWDIDGKPGESAKYWLEDVDLDGTSTWHGPIFSNPATEEQWWPVSREIKLLEGLANDNSRKSSEVPTTLGAMATAVAGPQLNLAAQSAIKVSVKEEGWYRISQEELVAAGLEPSVNPQKLQLFVEGRQVPMLVNGEKDGKMDPGDTIEFYGVGLDTNWTDTRAYWLVAGADPGQRIQQVEGVGVASSKPGYLSTVERRDRTIYFSALKNEDEDNFFGAVVSGTPVDQTLTLKSIQQGWALQADLEVKLQGVTAVDHMVKVSLNGIDLGEIAFTRHEQGIGKYSISQASLNEGNNVVTLRSLLGATDISLVASIRVIYWHAYRVDGNSLLFSANGKEQITLDGFSNRDIRVVDVTNAGAPEEVSALVKEIGSEYSATFVAPGAGQRRLLALTNETVKRPAGIALSQPARLREKTRAADLVVITTRALIANADPLKVIRERQGLKVLVVDVESIYDEFNWGHKTPQAIKDFLAYAKANWTIGPKWALLLGDATFDPRNYVGGGAADLIPTKMVPTPQFETASDDWLADFNGDGVADVALGRLPVRTAAEASTVIGKIVDYEQTRTTNSVLLVTDKNEGYDFAQATARVKSYIPKATNVQEVNRSTMDDAQASAEVTASINRGAKLVNYLGHGSSIAWNGSLLTASSVDNLSNRDQLSIFVLMTCLNGIHQNVSSDSLAEKLLKSSGGGAVAVWASSAMTEAEGQSPMNEELIKHLFSGKPITIGEAIIKAKTATTDLVARKTWTFFGDPSMKPR